jgi:hypothetical protein
MMMYQLSFMVDEEKLPTILGALAKEGLTFQLSEVDGSASGASEAPERKARKATYSSRQIRNSALWPVISTAVDVSGTLLQAHGRELLAGAGFSADSLGSFMSRAVRAGFFRHGTARGEWVRLK